MAYTPKHGSWLDLAESELSVLSSQCLDRRIGDIESLRGQVAAWVADRNKNQAKADWQFTTDDAQVKLKALYPIFPGQNRRIGLLDIDEAKLRHLDLRDFHSRDNPLLGYLRFAQIYRRENFPIHRRLPWRLCDLANVPPPAPCASPI
jgi:hypothetical protein